MIYLDQVLRTVCFQNGTRVHELKTNHRSTLIVKFDQLVYPPKTYKIFLKLKYFRLLRKLIVNATFSNNIQKKNNV